MATDEPGQLPGVDLVVLAGLVAPLLANQSNPEDLAQRVADAVIAELRPTLDKIAAAMEVERRRLGPYIPPVGGSPN